MVISNMQKFKILDGYPADVEIEMNEIAKEHSIEIKEFESDNTYITVILELTEHNTKHLKT